ncbi:MFS transporter [Pseudomonas sp. Xaverov 259]|uniref:MFS transporter n=1 Tax=Pseudomonas sp. Xaverov 259 TaxID=2666086 RepID=UPI001C5A9361|nr:MFS transporter [Pseudomonas sp. Xaverov 259]
MNSKQVSALWMSLLLALSYVLVMIDRRIFGAVLSSLRQELGLSATAAALAADASLLGIAATSIGAGYLARGINRKAVAVAGLLLTSAATVGVACAEGFTSVFLARLMLGVGISLLVTSAFTMAINYFVRQSSATVATLFFVTGLGATLGMSLGEILEGVLGWRSVLVMLGFMGLPLTVLIVVFVKPWFSQSRVISLTYDVHTQRVLVNSIWSRVPALLGFIVFWVGLTVYSFRNLYIPHILEADGFTWTTGQIANSLYAFGNLFAFYGAFLFRRFGARSVLVATLPLAGALSLVMCFEISHGAALYILFASVMGISLGGIAAVALLSEMLKSVVSKEVGPTIGLYFACFYGAGTLSVPLSRTLQDAIGWSFACMVLIAGSLLVAGGLAIFLPKSGEPRNGRHRS